MPDPRVKISAIILLASLAVFVVVLFYYSHTLTRNCDPCVAQPPPSLDAERTSTQNASVEVVHVYAVEDLENYAVVLRNLSRSNRAVLDPLVNGGFANSTTGGGSELRISFEDRDANGKVTIGDQFLITGLEAEIEYEVCIDYKGGRSCVSF